MIDELLTIEMFQALAPAFDAVVSVFAKFFTRFHWAYLLPTLAMVAAVWLYQRRELSGPERDNVLSFLFPKRVWLHRSALLDYRFVLFDKIVLGLLIAAGGLLLASGEGKAIVDAGNAALGNDDGLDWGVIAAYTVALLLVEDLLRYWSHRLMHTIPVLWHFHKVHHSPEVLIPFSQMRQHPVNGLISVMRSVLAIGLVTGAFMLVFPGELTVLSILGVNVGRFVFNAMGAHLRHSHIWLSFGPGLSRILVSPAMHQIHHSKLERHIDRNFGSQFALWDWMFGTIYVPRQRENLVLGIDEGDTARMQSVVSLYVEPFKDAWSELKKARRPAASGGSG
jgi:sterol desaturase/sphingolipid hydroxylase (fatty acid hydroxylase superfamily)